MPIWVYLLEYAVKGLIWLYGHPAVMDKVKKYTPLPPDADPSPKSEQGPIEPHFGG